MKWSGNNIKQFIEGRNINISTLANKVGVSRPTVYGWINGQAPKGKHILKICQLLDIEPSQLFTNNNSIPISIPVHRQRRASHITSKTQKEAFHLSTQYLNLFRNSKSPEVVTVIRDAKEESLKIDAAKKIALKLRKNIEIPPEKPMDLKYTFKLIEELGINIIFKNFPDSIKSYAFYTKIANHRVVFVNNSTNIIDLIFPLLHESIHAIRDEVYRAEEYDIIEETFCDNVANRVQFPIQYVKLVYDTIIDLNPPLQINKLKIFSRQNIHSLFGIIKAIKLEYPDFELNVGGADSNLRKEFSTIGNFIYNHSNVTKFVDTLKNISKNFYSMIESQINFISDRKLAQLMEIDNIFDANQIREELLCSDNPL